MRFYPLRTIFNSVCLVMCTKKNYPLKEVTYLLIFLPRQSCSMIYPCDGISDFKTGTCFVSDFAIAFELTCQETYFFPVFECKFVQPQIFTYAVRLCITKKTCVNRNYISGAEPSNRNLFLTFFFSIFLLSPLCSDLNE